MKIYCVLTNTNYNFNQRDKLSKHSARYARYASLLLSSHSIRVMDGLPPYFNIDGERATSRVIKFGNHVLMKFLLANVFIIW